MSQPLYQFRHEEEKLFPYQLLAGVLALVAVRYSLSTLEWFLFFVICIFVGFFVYILISFLVFKKYKQELPKIVNGVKRIRLYSLSISFCVITILYAGALISNRHIPIGVLYNKEASVVSSSRVFGPKIFGWDATIVMGGKKYYQMVSKEHYYKMQESSKVKLTLRKGIWGFSYIEAVVPING